jgi:integrase
MASVVIKTLSDGRRVYYAQVKRAGGWTRIPTGIEAKGPRSEKAAQQIADAKQNEIDEAEKHPPQPEPEVKLCGPLLEEWIESLDNRAHKTDEWQAKKYLLPRFAELPIKSVTKSTVIKWLDELAMTKKTTRTRKGKTIKSAEALSSASQKKLFTLLSRFLSWCSARDYIDSNPCLNVPTTERPQDSAKRKRPWLSDAAKVQAMCWALGPRFGLMFAAARTGGLRLCEVAGLRLSDTDWLEAEGNLHVRFSYDREQLKEDKGHGPDRKDKWSPIHDATVAVSLVALAERRRAAGAKEDDRLSDHLPVNEGAIRTACARAWRDAAAAVGGVDGLGWYESSRHSFVSGGLAAGARFEDLSKAVGHSSPSVTARYYVERKFASVPTSDIGAAPPEPAKVIPLRRVS